jgi:hypothetical protein
LVTSVVGDELNIDVLVGTVAGVQFVGVVQSPVAPPLPTQVAFCACAAPTLRLVPASSKASERRSRRPRTRGVGDNRCG